jgi:hypothetical protein
MAHEPAVRQAVRAKYIQGMPLDAACELADVSYQTARNWKRKAKLEGDDWDIARRAKRLGAGGVADLTGQFLEDMAEQFLAVMQDMRKATDLKPMQKSDILLKLSDAYIKTMAAAAKGNPKLDRLSVAMDLIQDLTAFVAEHQPAMRGAFLDLIEAFGPEVVRKFGPTA